MSQKSKIPRSEIFLTTKVQGGAHTPDGARAKIEKSLQDLGLDYVDLFLIHGPLMGPEKRIETWRNVTHYAKETGKVKNCGVSNL